jgi:sugar-specific transcriptional regulator TrmB
MDTKILEDLGFTQGEIKVYLALLELGETTTGPVITHSKITGSKVYEILEKLKEKGMVSSIIKEKTMYFQAASPSRILDYVDKKETELDEKKILLKKLLPELEAKREITKKTQTAQVFEGWQGIRTVFNLILEETGKNNTYYVFTVGKELEQKETILFLKGHHQRRMQKGVKVDLLLNSTDRKFLPEWNTFKNLEMRFYPYSLPLGVYIFGDYVATISFTNKTAFLIKSEYVADSYKKFFLDFWKIAKK